MNRFNRREREIKAENPYKDLKKILGDWIFFLKKKNFQSFIDDIDR